jgi:nucleotide-binding universal stress UspA family protein
MTVSDMLVTIERTKASAARLALAAVLAEKFKAHLIGVAAAPPLADAFGPVGYDAGIGPVSFDSDEFVARRKAQAERAAAAVEAEHAEFERVASRHGLSAEWRLAADWSGSELAIHARYADLAVIGQVHPNDDRLITVDPADVALGSGCPVLVVPHAGRHETIERHALIAWNASREARRAVQDALPLLKLVRSVTVLSVGSHRAVGGRGGEAGADIALHLARHGLKVTVEQTLAGDLEPADVLLSRAVDLGSDLIVMGAYGHARLREMVLGGATRSILRQMTVPVLMSH